MEGKYGENSGIRYLSRMACKCSSIDSWKLLGLTYRIPLMAMTAQFYFGKRAWLLWGKKTWIKWFFTIVPTITMMCGVAYVFLSARSSLSCANQSVLR